MLKPMAKLLLILAISTFAVFGADNSLGTWKLNVEKSKYTPGPLPFKSITVVREASDGAVKVTVTGDRADGTAVNYSYTSKYDGTPATVTGTGSPYDTTSTKRVNASTLTSERKNTGGSYHATVRTVVSKDGKTMTQTAKGTGTDGKPSTSTLVLEKQ